VGVIYFPLLHLALAVTLPETSIPSIFRCYVDFREGRQGRCLHLKAFPLTLNLSSTVHASRQLPRKLCNSVVPVMSFACSCLTLTEIVENSHSEFFCSKFLYLQYVPLTHPQKIGGSASFQGPVSGDLLTWTWQTLDFHLCQNQKSLYREWSSQNRESLYHGYTNLTIGYITYKTPSGLMSLSPISKLWEFSTCETGRHVYHSHSWLENDTIKWWHFTQEKTGVFYIYV